jgi:predicted transcriptional regulator
MRTGRIGRQISVGGNSLTCAQWAKKLGLTKQGIERRLKTQPAEEALSKRKTARVLTHNGASLTVKQWAGLLDRSCSRIYALVQQGRTDSEALGLEN